MAIDDPTVSWEGRFFYAFSPFTLLRVMQKIKHEKATGIVVVPNLPSAPWFPVFQSILMSETLKLQASSNIILTQNREETKFWKSLTLEAGVLSGETISWKASPRNLQKSWSLRS